MGDMMLWFTVAVAAVILFAWLSPIPAVFTIRLAFSKGNAVPPEDYAELASCVNAFKDLRYPSKYRDNFADIYLPKTQNGKIPVVLWIHGGAFVGGSKKDVAIYATALAVEGVAVVCMNYRRAPEAKYPVPVRQTAEAYRWLNEIAEEYDFDMDRFLLAGDSAGAHIAAQFAAIQSNVDYAHALDFEQIVPLPTLRAVLLFCGPFDVAKIGGFKHAVFGFFMRRVAWAYTGARDWTDPRLSQLTIADYITKDFPATFITDGNYLSFEEHGRALAEALAAKGVVVESHFIPREETKAAHEYQFVMNKEVGQEAFQHVVRFLETHTKLSCEGEHAYGGDI